VDWFIGIFGFALYVEEKNGDLILEQMTRMNGEYDVHSQIDVGVVQVLSHAVQETIYR